LEIHLTAYFSKSLPMPASPEDLFAKLTGLGISFTTHDHTAVFTVEQAKQVHDAIPGGHCKNLFCKDDKGVFWLIVCLEDAVVDLKAAPAKIGSRRLSFGKPPDMLALLGVIPGSVTPFGLINDSQCQINVILDEAMMALPVLNYHPLHNGATTTISNTDLLTFIRACGHSPKIVAVSA
jgi:Ala-tRNA(Pro) deacylase